MARALCQLQLSFVPVEILQIIEEDQLPSISEPAALIYLPSSVQRKALDNWLKDCSLPDSLSKDYGIVPLAWLAKSTAVLLKQRLTDGLPIVQKSQELYEFRDKTYYKTSIPDIQVNSIVFSTLHQSLRRVCYIGMELGEALTDIFVFTSPFPQTNEIGINEAKASVHAGKLDTIYPLKEIAQMEEATRGLLDPPTMVEFEGFTRLLYTLPKSQNQPSSSSIPVNRNDRNDRSSAQDSEPNPKEREASAECAKPLERSKVTEHECGFQTNQVVKETGSNFVVAEKLVLFGDCTKTRYEIVDVESEKHKVGDVVIASANGNGTCGMIKKIFSTVERPEIVYLDVKFEDSLQFMGLYVKVVHRCQDKNYNCRALQPVSIDTRYIHYDTAPGNLFVISGSEQANKENSEETFDNREEEDQTDFSLTPPIDVNEVIQKGQLSTLRITGNQNSCYADTFCFSFFAFFNNFDQYLYNSGKENGKDEDEAHQRLRNTLWFNIIQPLRKTLRLDNSAIQKFRNLLAEQINPSYKHVMMDIEEFALTIFQNLMQLPGFIEYDNGASDYIHQIFVSEDNTEDTVPDLQSLLVDSFKIQDVKLKNIPSPAFIIKLPVCNGTQVLPKIRINPNISLNDITTSNSDVEVELKVVIFLRKSHFTCLVKAGCDSRGEPIWLYHDSMPAQDVPHCVEAVGAQNALMHAAGALGLGNRWFEKLTTSSYMCIYFPERNPDA